MANSIVPCGEHIKGGEILYETRYYYCSVGVFLGGDIKHRHSIVDALQSSSGTSTVDHPNYTRYYHIEYRPTSPMVTRTCGEHSRCVWDILNLGVSHRMFADCCALFGYRPIADSWRRNKRRTFQSMH